MLHTVVSISAEPAGYQDWQARLLAMSHARVGQPGPLTYLVATAGAPPAIPGAAVLTHPPASPHPHTGDNYPPYNKPAALTAWFAQAPPSEEIICILDPDCWFRAPVCPRVRRGHAVAQRMDYMRAEEAAAALRPYRADVLRRRLMGIPLFVHRDDLAALVPGWVRYTAALRADPVTRAALGWVAEMWAYLLAAADCGLQHHRRQLAWSLPGQPLTTPLVHYCYSYPGDAPPSAWQWCKRTYRAWDAVPPWPATLPAPMQDVLTALNALAAQARGEAPPVCAALADQLARRLGMEPGGADG